MKHASLKCLKAELKYIQNMRAIKTLSQKEESLREFQSSLAGRKWQKKWIDFSPWRDSSRVLLPWQIKPSFRLASPSQDRGTQSRTSEDDHSRQVVLHITFLGEKVIFLWWHSSPSCSLNDIWILCDFVSDVYTIRICEFWIFDREHDKFS